MKLTVLLYKKFEFFSCFFLGFETDLSECKIAAPLLCIQAEMMLPETGIAIFRGTQPLGIRQTVTWSLGLERGNARVLSWIDWK